MQRLGIYVLMTCLTTFSNPVSAEPVDRPDAVLEQGGDPGDSVQGGDEGLEILKVHLFEVDMGGTRYLISWLPPQTVMVVGLVGEVVLGEVPSPEDMSSQTFKTNPEFRTFLQRAIRSRAGECVDLIQAGQAQGEGYVYISDERAISADGTLDPKDIFGAFPVTGGVLQLEAYWANDQYQVMTEQGFPQPPRCIAKLLLEEINKLAATHGQPGQ